ncbi:MAG TPA: hypothetical protein VLT33_07150 [Labilithrix sp.]|nr:hypothetical protein [Labilithrix sp.]
MDEERIKQAVLSVIERTDFARQLAKAVEPLAGNVATAPAAREQAPSAGTQRLLTRIVLGDILDDTILGARPQDRTFPLRLLFSELGSLLAHDGDEGPKAHAAELAFTFASGLNFFFRATMDPEAKIRVGLEVSRQLYVLAHDAKMDAEVIAKAAPLLATMMSTELERVRYESIDHAKVYDSQVHERTADSDPTGSRILRPASFLCRVTTNNAVKAKAQVVT